MKSKKTSTPKQKSLIGWREWLSLPELGIDHIKAKIDTGARTSALHALNLRPFEREGRPWLAFDLHPLQRQTETTVHAEAPMVEERWIRSSNGHRSLRPVILTTIALGDFTWTTEITLVRRDLMGFRMLLGRQSLRGHFLINPGRSFLWGRPSRSEHSRFAQDILSLNSATES